MLPKLNQKGKALVPAVVATLLVLAAGLVGATALAQPAASTGNSVSVSGTAQVVLKPDMAYVTLGTTSFDTDAAKARAANNTAMEKVLAAVKAQGVEDKDIQTTNYSIYPRYNTDGKTVSGYEVNNAVQVTVRNLDKLGNVIADATSAGANMANGLSFDVQNREDAYNQALKLAIEDAHKRAQTLAKSAGQSLGQVLGVTENGSYAPYPIYFDYVKNAGAPMSAGSLNVSASVSMTYALQ